MTPERTELFIAWLDKKLSDAHLSDSELARRARMSHSVLSKARKGILPRYEACAKIAHGLKVDPIEVFRAAGLLTTPKDLDSDFERLKDYYGSLSHKKRDFLVEFAAMLVEKDLS